MIVCRTISQSRQFCRKTVGYGIGIAIKFVGQLVKNVLILIQYFTRMKEMDRVGVETTTSALIKKTDLSHIKRGSSY